MPNINTIAYQQAGIYQNNIGPLNNANAGTSETAVPLLPNGLISTLGGGVIPLSVPAGSSSIALWSSQVADQWNTGKPFKIRAYGTVTTGTTCNITVKLYQVPASIVLAGTAATLGNDNVMATSGTFAVNTASANFVMEVEASWDSTGKKLGGSSKFYVNGALVAETVLTAITTATATAAELNFILTGTFSAGNAANVLQVQWFELEQV